MSSLNPARSSSSSAPAEVVCGVPSGSLLPPDNSIGFIRLLLAGMVMFTHAHLLGGFGSEWLTRINHRPVAVGYLAVQTFFVISGVLIAESWRRRPHLGVFLWHRLLRLAPALWGCLAVTALVFTPLWWLTTRAPRPPWADLVSTSFTYIVHNLFLPRSQIGIGPFPADVPWSGDWNGSLWTLFYEGACYLMIAGLGLLGLIGRWRWAGAGLLLSFAALFTVVELTGPGHWPTWIARLFDTPGKQLTVAFLAGAAWSAHPGGATAIAHRGWLALAALVLLTVSWRTGHDAALAPWVLPPLVLWLAVRLPWPNFERKVGGDYSYGLYVYGYPVQQLLAHFRIHELGFWPYLFLTVAGAGGCAIASWHLVEKRALALKDVWPARGSAQLGRDLPPFPAPSPSP